MNCPSCQERVLRTDGYCKKCGHLLRDVRQKYSASNVYRPRAILLFKFVTGEGAHLRWLGYDTTGYESESKKVSKDMIMGFFQGFSNPDVGFFNMLVSILNMFIAAIKTYSNFILIVFGKYDTDAYGRPVRYFNPNKQKDYAKPAFDLTTVDFSNFINERLVQTGQVANNEAGIATVADGLALQSDVSKESGGIALQSDVPEESGGIALQSDVPEESGGIALQSDVPEESGGIALQGDGALEAGGLALQSDVPEESSGIALQGDGALNAGGLATQSNSPIEPHDIALPQEASSAERISNSSHVVSGGKEYVDKETHALSINGDKVAVGLVEKESNTNKGVTGIKENKQSVSDNPGPENISEPKVSNPGKEKVIAKVAKNLAQEKNDNHAVDNIAEKKSAESQKESQNHNSMFKRWGLVGAGICLLALGAYMYPYLTDTHDKAVQRYVSAISTKNYGDMYDLNYTSKDKDRDKKELIERLKLVDDTKAYSADSFYAVAPKTTRIREASSTDAQKEFILETPSGEYVLIASRVAAGPFDLLSKYIVKDPSTFKTVKIKAPSNAAIMVDGSVVDYNNTDNTYEYNKAFPGKHKYSISHDLYETTEGQFETKIDKNSEMVISDIGLPLKQETLAGVSKTSEDLLSKVIQAVLSKGGTDAIGYSYANDDSIAKMYNKLVPFFHRKNGKGIGKMEFKNATYQNYTEKVYYRGEGSKFTNFIEMNYSYQKMKGEVLDSRIGYGELYATIEYSIENNRIVPCRIVKWTMKLH